jgi:hypothetical protein
MRVVRGERHELRCEDRGERVFVLGPVHAQHRFHSGEGRSLGGDGRGIRAQQDDRDFTVRNGACAGDALRRSGVQRLSVVFADDEYFVH